ncbi:replication initiator [Nonomuraea sp. NPDC003804]|uniref:replication initiator n=1 Tax=Nonomuraea sp. NPDC003804 TaxID=3154547 RepID=UPI0033AE7C00
MSDTGQDKARAGARAGALGALAEAGLLELETARQVAIDNGVCVRPLAFRVTDRHSGADRVVNVACGARLESKCPPCAKRMRQLRAAQCREGWHLEAEPEIEPGPGSPWDGRASETGSGTAGGAAIVPAREVDEDERAWLHQFRDELRALRDAAMAAGRADEAGDWAAALAGHEAEMRALGVWSDGGDASGGAQTDSGTDDGTAGAVSSRRVRSTRRRQDAPALPKRVMRATTLGRTFTGRDGKVFRPSLFVTLTLPSYGRVRDGAPVDPDGYDYQRAARDALHFAKLVDRLVQNLRRVAGFEVQYFASVEPQRRLAPHLHMAIRGTIPRAELRRVIAATYHQVWWPPTGVVVFEGDHLPVWREEVGYLDPATGEVLPTWEEALDALGADPDATPLHVIRFGEQADIQGVLAGTPDADMRVRYLTKYLTKSLGDPLNDDPGEGADGKRAARARRAHARRLLEVLRWEPCSPGCANWLRFGVQPKNARAGMVPGLCRGKAHRAAYLGYAGRRVLVSRKWTGKTLGGYQRARRAWVLEALGIAEQEASEPGRYVWQQLKPDDPRLGSLAVRLLRMVAERQRGRERIADAQANEPTGEGGQSFGNGLARGPSPHRAEAAGHAGQGSA